jgi:hypothetical protein
MWPYGQAWLYYYKLPLWVPQYYIIRHGQQTYISGLFSQMKDDILKSEKGEGTEIPCDHRVVINVIWFMFLDERMTAYLKISFYCLVSHIVVSWYWSIWVHPQFLVGFMLLDLYFYMKCFVARCLSFCRNFSFDHCVVCPSSIYRFWLTLWYLQTLLWFFFFFIV